MMEEIKYTGVWWLPKVPENKVFGTLNIIYGEGIILTLSESFSKDNNDNELKVLNLKIVLGKSTIIPR